MHNGIQFAVTNLLIVFFASVLMAQAPVAPAPPVPTTKMEAFKPDAGSLLVKGYDDLGNAAYGVSVNAQERSNGRGKAARGLIVEVKEVGRLEREGRSFVDADEIPELLGGLDALLAIKTNPTQYKSFEVQYATRDDLQLTAFNDDKNNISYAIKAGRTLGATRYLKEGEMLKLKGLFEAAQQKLSTVAAGSK